MSEREITPLQQASQEIPLKWYEFTKKQVLIGIPSSVYLSSFLYDKIDIKPPRTFEVLTGGIIYAIASILDRYSTSKTIMAINEAKLVNIQPNIKEINPLLSQTDLDSPKSFNSSISTTLIDSLGMLLSISSLGVAIPIGSIKTLAYFNNSKKAERISRAVEIQKRGKNSGL